MGPDANTSNPPSSDCWHSTHTECVHLQTTCMLLQPTSAPTATCVPCGRGQRHTCHTHTQLCPVWRHLGRTACSSPTRTTHPPVRPSTSPRRGCSRRAACPASRSPAAWVDEIRQINPDRGCCYSSTLFHQLCCARRTQFRSSEQMRKKVRPNPNPKHTCRHMKLIGAPPAAAHLVQAAQPHKHTPTDPNTHAQLPGATPPPAHLVVQAAQPHVEVQGRLHAGRGGLHLLPADTRS